MRSYNVLEDFNLHKEDAYFIIEYLKDFSVVRAAEAVGRSPDDGYTMLQYPRVQSAIQAVLDMRTREQAKINGDWLLQEMIDNHRLARQMGQITASNAALNMIARHKRVDAYAADKIKVSSDADVVERLTAARQRVTAKTYDIKPTGEVDVVDEKEVLSL